MIDNISDILAVVTACEDLILATCGDKYPDARHVTNAMNRNATGLTLYFMTARGTPKYVQISNNPQCALYYFNPQNRHAVRLYGRIEFVSDKEVRRAHWRPEYEKFGYGGPDDTDFILMRFIPNAYKYYIGPEMKAGEL